MKFRTTLCIALLGLATLACGGTSSSDVTFDGAGSSVGGSSLQAPWDSMGLPNDQTNIVAQTSNAITMDVPGDPKSVGEKYEKAITGAGWSTTSGLMMMGDSGGGVYSKDGKTLSLGISKSFSGGDGTSVSIAIN